MSGSGMNAGVYFARVLVDGAVHAERRIVLTR
jgi:hypothetical protein